jgi:hypothetical protein
MEALICPLKLAFPLSLVCINNRISFFSLCHNVFLWTSDSSSSSWLMWFSFVKPFLKTKLSSTYKFSFMICLLFFGTCLNILFSLHVLCLFVVKRNAYCMSDIQSVYASITSHCGLLLSLMSVNIKIRVPQYEMLGKLNRVHRITKHQSLADCSQ